MTKPAAVCRWIFTLLGAAPGDSLDDLFPSSGAVSRAWDAYTGQHPSCQARADASSPAASDGSYPSSEASQERLVVTMREQQGDTKPARRNR